MTAVVCFELIPEARAISNTGIVIAGIVIGIITMLFVKNRDTCDAKNNNLIKLGLIVGLGLSIHNFPEGLAIGSRIS